MIQSIHLLITHGSRNVRSQQSAEQLRSHIETDLNENDLNENDLNENDLSPERSEPETQFGIKSTLRHRVEHAVLEGGSTALHTQILHYVDCARAEGLDRLQLLPLFLMPGVHVMEDLPQEVALAQKLLVDRDPHFKLSTLPYLGHHLQTHSQSLASAWGSEVEPGVAKVLLSHGSRRSDSTLLSEQFANSIGATPAYWSIEPSLTQTVERLFTEGYEEIQVLLYFLFPGGITSEIEASIVRLRQSYPGLNLTCKPTLDQISEFPKFLADVLQNSMVQNQSLQAIHLQNRSALPHSFYAEVNR